MTAAKHHSRSARPSHLYRLCRGTARTLTRFPALRIPCTHKNLYSLRYSVRSLYLRRAVEVTAASPRATHDELLRFESQLLDFFACETSISVPASSANTCSFKCYRASRGGYPQKVELIGGGHIIRAADGRYFCEDSAKTRSIRYKLHMKPPSPAGS